MAVPTVAGVDIATRIRSAISDTDSSNYEFSDVDLTGFLARATDFYNRYRPYVLRATLTTINNQDMYALPTDCMKLIEANWRPYPGLSSNTVVAFFNALYGSVEILPSKDWRDEALNRIREELATRFERVGAGTTEQVTYTTSYAPSQFVILYPTPTRDGDTINIRYVAKAHPLQSNDYFTIPPFDVQFVEKLLWAECLSARSSRLSASPDYYTAGTTTIRYLGTQDALERKVMRLQQEVIDALSTPVIGRG